MKIDSWKIMTAIQTSKVRWSHMVNSTAKTVVNSNESSWGSAKNRLLWGGSNHVTTRGHCHAMDFCHRHTLVMWRLPSTDCSSYGEHLTFWLCLFSFFFSVWPWELWNHTTGVLKKNGKNSMAAMDWHLPPLQTPVRDLIWWQIAGFLRNLKSRTK